MITGHSGTTLTDACEAHHGVEPRKPGQKLPATVLPNPDFSEWILRLPAQWSLLDSPPSGMRKILSSQRPHGGSSAGLEPGEFTPR